MSEKRGSSRLTNIAIGIVAIVLFASLFILTNNGNIKQTDSNSILQNDSNTINVSNVNNHNGIDLTRNFEQHLTDSVNLQRAISYKNKYFCEQIQNASMKKDCETNIPSDSINAEPTKNTYTVNDVEDRANYNRAISYKNKYFCEQIQNASMKKDCETNIPSDSINAEPTKNTYTVNDVEDNANYNRAMLYKNTDFCKEISDLNLKEKCFTNAEN